MKLIYQKYFQTKRMKGNREPEFLQRVNGVFICLVSTAIRHCLKLWRTGEYQEGGPDFKYETAWRKWTWILEAA